jgi:Tfp pilus assembly protein PilF
MTGNAATGQANSARTGVRTIFLLAAIILVAGAAAYHASLAGPLVFDDLGSIRDNATLRQLWPPGPVLAPPRGLTVSGRPVLNLSLAVNYAVSGPRVGGYHVLNLAIHLLAALALFGILRRTLPPTARAPDPALPAFAISLLWAVHPLHTESVTYIVQRAESLMGLWYLLTVYCFIRYAEGRKAWAGPAFLCCLLGMGTKEVMVSAPLIVLLYDRTFVSGSLRAAWRRHRGLHLALAATWIPLAWLVAGAGSRGGTAGFHAAVPWTNYGSTQLWAIVHYLRLSFWPRPLVFYYGRMLRTHVTAAWVADAAVVGLLAAGTLLALRRWPRLGFAGAWFFAILAPTSSVVPVATETVAEHRMYLALIPVLVLVVLGVIRVLPRPAALAGLLAAALGLAALTLARNQAYASDLTLWRDTVRDGPENPVAHNNLGEALRTRGLLPEARDQFEQALRLDPSYPDAGNNLGVTLAAQGRPDEAIARLARTAALKPDDAETQLNWGNVLQEQGDLAAAALHYDAALRLEPERADSHFDLGKMLLREGRLPEAAVQLAEAVRLRPEDAEARNNLGIALAETGRPGEAEAQFVAALRLTPESLKAHSNLGSLLLAENRVPEAVAQYEQALALAPRLPEAHYNLGVAWLRTGKRPAARDQFEAALRLRPDYAEARAQLDLLPPAP